MTRKASLNRAGFAGGSNSPCATTCWLEGDFKRVDYIYLPVRKRALSTFPANGSADMNSTSDFRTGTSAAW